MPVRMLSIGGSLLAVAGAAPASAAAPRLASIEAKLLGARTGAPSKNILPPASFNGWNTAIGEGDATEPADDLLVVIGLTMEGDEGNSDVPLLVKVSGNGKPLAQRTFKSLYFSKGRTSRYLLLPDAACAGSLVIEARFGTQAKTAKVKLGCGE